MDWKNFLAIGSYVLFFTGLLIVYGHPVRNHAKKSHHVLTRKAKISKQLQHTKKPVIEKKSSFLNRQLAAGSTEDAKKKGTIRISGPWHSESGLDRNVDPMEDSYVKKIISSNEGLNFNKDMAEAGEVFDVNGIDDFYDRDALITYEINGHEIPVHLKQKLTPQTQPMFPEYGHDSQLSAETSSRNGHSYAQRNPGGHKVTTFFGMSLKDMPEYKVHDTPSFNDKQQKFGQFSERARMDTPRFDHEGAFSRQSFANVNKPNSLDSSIFMPSAREFEHRAAQSPFDKFASEYEQANEVGQEDANFGSRFHRADRNNFESEFHGLHRPLDASVSGFEMHQNPDRFYGRMNSERDPIDSNDGHHLKDLATHKRPGDQEALLEEISRLREHKNPPVFPSPSHSEQFYQKRPSDPVQFSDSPRPVPSDKPGENLFKTQEVKNFFNRQDLDDHSLPGESRGVGKDFDGGRLAPSAAETDKSKAEGKLDDSSRFFEQLEKIDQERQKSERERQEMLPGKSIDLNASFADMADKVQRYSDDSQRTKAKDKLLKILGDLTSKLKGMEAAVKDTHTDERRESPSVSNFHGSNEASNEKKEEETSRGSQHKEPEASKEETRHEEARNDALAKEEAKKEEARKEETAKEETRKAESAKEEASKSSQAMADNGKGAMDNTREYPWEAREDSPGGKSSHEVEPNASYSPHGSDEGAGQEHVSHMINNLKQKGQPFIFNTEEIDYKGPHYEEMQSVGDEENSQSKDHMHYHRYDQEGHLMERPIMSSFYHEQDRNDEFDTHAFHQENRASSESEVTPTQRDGGRNSQKALRNKDESESEEKSSGKDGNNQANTKELKSDPDDDLPDYNEVKDAAIFEENFIRKKYHSPSLRWSDDLSDEAQKEADDLAEEKSLNLNKKSIPRGMNVALLPLSSLNVGRDSADVWRKEAAKFDFVSPIISKKNNDFAQMVWKTAKEFGLGVAKSRDKENWIVVAKYDTPAVSEYEQLKANIESDIPVADPYSDIARRGRISKTRNSVE